MSTDPHHVDVHDLLIPTPHTTALRRLRVRGVAGSGILCAPEYGYVTVPRTGRLP